MLLENEAYFVDLFSPKLTYTKVSDLRNRFLRNFWVHRRLMSHPSHQTTVVCVRYCQPTCKQLNHKSPELCSPVHTISHPWHKTDHTICNKQRNSG